MSKRQKESAGERNGKFGRTASKVHKKNIPGTPMRGGIRL